MANNNNDNKVYSREIKKRCHQQNLTSFLKKLEEKKKEIESDGFVIVDDIVKERECEEGEEGEEYQEVKKEYTELDLEIDNRQIQLIEMTEELAGGVEYITTSLEKLKNLVKNLEEKINSPLFCPDKPKLLYKIEDANMDIKPLTVRRERLTDDLKKYSEDYEKNALLPIKIDRKTHVDLESELITDLLSVKDSNVVVIDNEYNFTGWMIKCKKIPKLDYSDVKKINNIRQGFLYYGSTGSLYNTFISRCISYLKSVFPEKNENISEFRNGLLLIKYVKENPVYDFIYKLKL